jgi:flagellar basal-body rod protein FlgB
MEIATRLSHELAGYLDLNTREIQLTAANMANIDTPGYRAVGMDFAEEVRRAMAEADRSDGPEAGPTLPRVFQVDGLIVRPDGNDVSMDRESLNLARAQLQFKTGVALLKREYTRIFDAIHADAK